ncbi:unnamed protein product [Amoebophrya sp. A25]|nr:unnamed protein product [Amoebophrya sp. A25]|eukprot:GSA25T00016255001.1
MSYWDRQEKEFLARLDKTLDDMNGQSSSSTARREDVAPVSLRSEENPVLERRDRADGARGDVASSAPMNSSGISGIVDENRGITGAAPETTIIGSRPLPGDTRSSTTASSGSATIGAPASVNYEQLKTAVSGDYLTSVKATPSTSTVGSETEAAMPDALRVFVEKMHKLIQKRGPGFNIQKFLDGTVMNKDSFGYLVEDVFEINCVAECGRGTDEIFDLALRHQDADKLDLVRLLI